MRITCDICGKVISSEVPDNTILRAWVECLKCIEKQEKKSMKKLGVNEVIITWLQRYPLLPENPSLKDYESVPLGRRYLCRKGEDGKWWITKSPEQAMIFTVAEAINAIIEFRSMYRGDYAMIQIDCLSYFPND